MSDARAGEAETTRAGASARTGALRGLAAAAAPWSWGALATAAALWVGGLEPNLVEEGLVVHVAQRLLGGEHLYRDVVFFTGPLPFELLALLFRLFGEQIAVGRVAMAVLLGLTGAATFATARRSGAGAGAAAAAACVAACPLLLFPLFSMYYYTPLAWCLSVLAVDAASRALHADAAHAHAWAIGSGVLVAAVALCKQTLGVALAVGLVASVALAAPPGRRLARASGVVLGGAGLAALVLAFYALRGDLDALWRCLVTLPMGLSSSYRAPFVNLWPPGELAEEIVANRPLYFSSLYFLRYGLFTSMSSGAVLAMQIAYALPLLALALTPLARLAGPLPAGVWLHGALLLAMTSNVFPRSDWGHLALALPPAAVQLVLLASLAGGTASTHPRAARVAALAVVAALAFCGLSLGRFEHASARESRWGPRVPQRPVSLVYQLHSVPRVISFLRERVTPGEPIFVARAEPLLYFATGTVNPTPYTGVLTTLRDDQQARILEALPRVRFVVMSDIDQPLWTYYADELPLVQKHLERFYRIPPYFPLDDHSWIVVLERGPDRGPTLVDLVDEAAGGRAFVREEKAGPELPSRRPLAKLAARQNRRPLPVWLGRFGGGVDFELEVPPGARFEADIGFRGMVSLADLHEHPKRSRMVVSVARQGGDFEVIAAQRVDDGRDAGRRWTPLAADLARFVGERVTLRLEVVPDGPVGRADLAWWGSPRLAGEAPGEPRKK